MILIFIAIYLIIYILTPLKFKKMSENIRIIIRVRPQLNFQNEPIWMIKNNTISTISTLSYSKRNSSSERKTSRQNQKDIQYKFKFQSVIEERVSTQQIYKNEIKSTLIQSYNSFRNVSIMAYGQTCSGKTHTILGVKQSPGIIPCVLRDLFLIKKQKERKCNFKISYIQIYNQKISDLLDAKEKAIKIVESTAKIGYEVSGVLKQNVNSFEDSLKLLERGEKNRQYGEGQYHQRSSRSHTLLNIFIDEWNSNLQVKSFVITIVDLAGSERLVQPQQSSTQAGYINKSLFQLTNCISKLADKAPHIPFRDSKLTKLLQSSLTDSGRSFIICCVSPSKNCFSETLSTLRLAERAKKIELSEPIQAYTHTEADTLKLKLQQKTKQCNSLKKQIQNLTNKLKQLSSQLQRQKSKKQPIKTNLLILFDHQNFTLFHEDHIDTFYTTSKSYDCIKQKFVSKMQQLYQNYTKQIVSQTFGDTFQLQIQQLCFMNMVLQHQKINQYKIDIISQLLKQKENQTNQQNHTFYKALEQYQHKLRSQCNSLYSARSYQSYQSSNYTQSNNSLSLSFKDSPHIKQTNHNTSMAKSQIKYGSEMWIWGCKKDFRVCKGQSINVNIVRINNLGKIRSVVCGYHHTLVVTQLGQLFGWGKNTQKQIINNNKQCISNPTEIKGLERIQSAAAGWGHSLALTWQGQLYSWGYGKDGQLGHSTQSNSEIPKKIEHQCEIVSANAGHSHSAFLDIYGDLYTFGFNQDYRLMIGDQRQVYQPKRISIREVTNYSLGVTHSAVVTSNGNVYAGGTGRNGQLGIFLDENISGWERLQVVDRKFQEENYQKICPLIQMQSFNRNNKAKSVKCGQNMTFILNEAGQVYSFGKTTSHRLGQMIGSPTKIIQNIDLIECGMRTGFAISNRQNKLYSWGFNMYGQANPETKGDIEQPELFQNLPNRQIVHISSGFFHSAIVFQ